MKRNYIPLQISIPMTQDRVHIGDIEVSAHLCKDGSFDFNHIKWHGQDLLPLLVVAGKDLIQTCIDALKNNVDSLSSFERWQLENYGNVLCPTTEPDADTYSNRITEWADSQAQLEEIINQ